MITIGIILLLITVFWICVYIKFDAPFTLRFNTAINTLELPIVTLISNGEAFNFLVDTGSNKSHLKIGVAEQMDSRPIFDKSETVITTGNGKVQQYGYYDVTFTFGDKRRITQCFEVMDLEDTFSDWGMPIHGILGVDFLACFGYKLDFSTFTMHV